MPTAIDTDFGAGNGVGPAAGGQHSEKGVRAGVTTPRPLLWKCRMTASRPIPPLAPVTETTGFAPRRFCSRMIGFPIYETEAKTTASPGANDRRARAPGDMVANGFPVRSRA